MKATPPNDECISRGGEECVTLAFPTIIHVYHYRYYCCSKHKAILSGGKIEVHVHALPLHALNSFYVLLYVPTHSGPSLPPPTHTPGPFLPLLTPSTHTSQLTAMRGGKVAFLTLLVLSREKRVEHTSYSARSSKVILDP